MNSKFIYICWLLMMFAASPLSATSVYKWVDEDGQVHFSSRPTNENAEEVEIKSRHIDSEKKTAPLSTEDRVNKQKRFLDALEAEKNAIKQEKRIKQKNEEDNLMRCHAARDQLKRAEASGSLYDLDNKGNRILLNKEQYDQALTQARARVEKWCNQ